MPQFPHAAHRLQPAKDLFHPLALPLTDRITTVPRRASINGALAPLIVLRHVRRHLEVAGLRYEILVRRQRPACVSSKITRELGPPLASGRAGGHPPNPFA